MYIFFFSSFIFFLDFFLPAAVPSRSFLSRPSLPFCLVCFLPASFRSPREETKTKPSPTLRSSPTPNAPWGSPTWGGGSPQCHPLHPPALPSSVCCMAVSGLWGYIPALEVPQWSRVGSAECHILRVIPAALLWGWVWSRPNGKLGVGTMGLGRRRGPSVGQSVFGALQRNVVWKFGGFPPL